jgi:hypothetical protein
MDLAGQNVAYEAAWNVWRGEMERSRGWCRGRGFPFISLLKTIVFRNGEEEASGRWFEDAGTGSPHVHPSLSLS